MLTREECLGILELKDNAQEWDIEKKYTMLVKKYRTVDTADAREKLVQISTAYNVLTGRYVEPVITNPKLEKVVAGKTIKQWLTVWHYGRLPLLFIVIAAALIISLVHSISTNTKSDYSVIVMGQFYDGGTAHDSIIANLFDVSGGFAENPDVHIIPINLQAQEIFGQSEQTTEITEENATDSEINSDEEPTAVMNYDPQSQYAYNMKLVTLLYADSVDFFMTTSSAFERYAPQGIFMEVQEFYESLSDLPDSVYSKIRPVYASIHEGEYDDAGDPILTDDSQTEVQMMGLDVSELDLFEGLDVWLGDSQIIAVGANVRDEDQTFDMLDKWIRDYENMSQRAAELASENEQLPEGAWRIS